MADAFQILQRKGRDFENLCSVQRKVFRQVVKQGEPPEPPICKLTIFYLSYLLVSCSLLQIPGSFGLVNFVSGILFGILSFYND